MPFTKILRGEDAGKYVSESGRIYTLRQIRAYYATGGWSRAVRRSNKKEGVTMNARTGKKSVTKASFAAFIFAVLVLTGSACSAGASSPSRSHAPAADQSVNHLPTAKEIAVKVGGTKFAQDHVGPVPNAIGQTSAGHFFIGGDFYIVSVFTSADAMNKWLHQGAMYGFTPKWKGDSWAVVPPDSNFTGPTLPSPF